LRTTYSSLSAPATSESLVCSHKYWILLRKRNR